MSPPTQGKLWKYNLVSNLFVYICIWKYQNIVNEVFFSEILTWRFAWNHAVFASAVLCKKIVSWWVSNSCVSVYYYSVAKHWQSTYWGAGLGVAWRGMRICGSKTCLALGHRPLSSRDPSSIFPHRSLPESQSSSDHKAKFCLPSVSTALSKIHLFRFMDSFS